MMKYWTKFFPASASANDTIKSYKVISQKNDTDSVNIKINACVDPFSAREAVYRLGLNNSIAVFIPARKPGGNGNEFEETNLLSEPLIGISSPNKTIPLSMSLRHKSLMRKKTQAMFLRCFLIM